MTTTTARGKGLVVVTTTQMSGRGWHWGGEVGGGRIMRMERGGMKDGDDPNNISSLL
jgi:hypothetical protein